MTSFEKRALNPWLFGLFMLAKLPMGLLAGLRVKELNQERAVVTIPFKFLNKNPFESIYFACLSMAAELSCGILAFRAVEETAPNVSMLITEMDAEFIKKAKGKISFTCADSKEILAAVQNAQKSSEGINISVSSCGKNEIGETVATFRFRWSFKARK